MIARLALNERAYGEAFTLGTGECRTWGEIASYYEEFLGARFIWVDTEIYLETATPNEIGDTWGLKYDRLCDRTIDTTKLFSVTGLSYEDFMPIRDALKMELAKVPADAVFFERLKPEVVAAIQRRQMIILTITIFDTDM